MGQKENGTRELIARDLMHGTKNRELKASDKLPSQIVSRVFLIRSFCNDCMVVVGGGGSGGDGGGSHGDKSHFKGVLIVWQRSM